MVEATKTKTLCTRRCWHARGKTCRCSCGGDNHGVRKNGSEGLFGEIPLNNVEATVKKPKEKAMPALSPLIPVKSRYIEGNGGTREVFFTDEHGGISEITPHKSWKLRNHSPDGFNWGYGGSGASQLALAILLELMDDERAQENYQQFKWDIITTLPQGVDFKIPMSAVYAWVEAHTEIRYSSTNA